MKGLLVVNEFLNTHKFNEIHNWLLEAGQKLGIDLKLKTNAELVMDITEGEYNLEADFILFWDKDVKLAYYLEQLGYPVFNSSKAIGICDDKALTHLELMKAGLPMPRTIIAPKTFDNIGYTNYKFLREVELRLGYPVVIKESFGSFGQQVYLAYNYDELLEKVKECGAKPLIFQEFINSSFGRDLRLQVVGGRVIASMYRYADNGDFRANITIGGKMQCYEPTKEQCDLALQCCSIIGLDFAGVDLLFGEDDKPMICEVNSNAHFKNIFDCTGVNAAEEIMVYILEKVSERII